MSRAIENMDSEKFIPFDSKCFSKLESRFGTLFETRLIDEICQNGSLKRYAADKILVDIGSTISHMPIVISGSIKVMTEDEKGNELLMYYLEKGNTCAMTMNCSSSDARSTIRAITETECEIIIVPISKMDYWMLNYKTWRTYILGSYNHRLNEMVQAFDNVVFHSLEERLKRYLREKAEIAGTAILKISHQDIANDLHATRVSISRLMRKLEANSDIEQQRNRVVILENSTK